MKTSPTQTPRISLGLPGSTPVKTFHFSSVLPPSSIPRCSPPSKVVGGKRYGSIIKKQQRPPPPQPCSPSSDDNDDDKYSSPVPSTSSHRPKTSRGRPNPPPDSHASYVVMSPRGEKDKGGRWELEWDYESVVSEGGGVGRRLLIAALGI